MKNAVGKTIVQGLMHLFGRLPLSVHYFNSRWIAWILEHVVKYRRNVVEDNLFHAFPDKSGEELQQIRSEFYRHFVRVFLEALWFGASEDVDQLVRSGLLKLVNPEYLDEIFKKSPSLMVMSSHAGNWEIFGGIISSAHPYKLSFDEKSLCVVYRKLSNAVFDEIMKENRIARIIASKEGFDGVVESMQALRFVLTHRSQQKLYCFITDQRPYLNIETAPEIMFMNRTCKYMMASVTLACKGGMAVLYLRMREQSIGHYTMEMIPICEDASQMSDEEIIRRYYALLEEDLRAQPYNYLWTHNRWWKP